MCAFPVSVVHGEWLPDRCVVFAVGAVGELVYVLLAVDCDSQIDDFSAWFQYGSLAVVFYVDVSVAIFADAYAFEFLSHAE